MYVMVRRFDRTGPLECLSPFPVWCWIRSDLWSDLRFLSPVFISRMKVANLFVFLTPPALPGVPLVRFHVCPPTP